MLSRTSPRNNEGKTSGSVAVLPAEWRATAVKAMRLRHLPRWCHSVRLSVNVVGVDFSLCGYCKLSRLKLAAKTLSCICTMNKTKKKIYLYMRENSSDANDAWNANIKNCRKSRPAFTVQYMRKSIFGSNLKSTSPNNVIQLLISPCFASPVQGPERERGRGDGGDGADGGGGGGKVEGINVVDSHCKSRRPLP